MVILFSVNFCQWLSEIVLLVLEVKDFYVDGCGWKGAQKKVQVYNYCCCVIILHNVIILYNVWLYVIWSFNTVYCF